MEPTHRITDEHGRVLDPPLRPEPEIQDRESRQWIPGKISKPTFLASHNIKRFTITCAYLAILFSIAFVVYKVVGAYQS